MVLLKDWKCGKSNLAFDSQYNTVQVALYVTVQGHLDLCLRCVVVGGSVVEGCLFALGQCLSKELMKGSKKFIESLFFYEKKKYFLSIYILTYSHRYSKYTNHRKHVQANFILPLGL